VPQVGHVNIFQYDGLEKLNVNMTDRNGGVDIGRNTGSYLLGDPALKATGLDQKKEGYQQQDDR